MSGSLENGRTLVSRHAAKRRRSTPWASTVDNTNHPELQFRKVFSSGQKSLVDLTYFPRPQLAREAVQLLWSGCHDGTYQSAGRLDDATQTLARLAEYLTEHDQGGRIDRIRDLLEPDIDGFDLWLHMERYDIDSMSPYVRLQGLTSFLGRALQFGLADPSVAERCRYTSKFHKAVDSKPRDAYDDFTMANLRAAAKHAVDKILERLARGETIANQCASQETLDRSKPASIIKHLRECGMVTKEDYDEIGRLLKNSQMSRRQVFDLAYIGIDDCVPFMILLAETTGLPIESVKELSADCIDAAELEKDFAVIRYVKRRRFGTEESFEESVPMRDRYSAGWLIRELCRITAPARMQLGFACQEGSLFVGRTHAKLQVHEVSSIAVRTWLKRNPIATDSRGGRLTTLQLSRIRKWHKASVEYVGGGGSLDAIRPDHTSSVFVRHYGNLPSLARRHEDAIEGGIQEAHDYAVALGAVKSDEHTATPPPSNKHIQDPIELGHERQAIDTDVQESWIAGCLDPSASPYSPRGQLCGAPLYGCLDCANAVFTTAKIPNLIRLSHHIAAERQRMDLHAWRQNYAFAYARVRQILALFSQADIDAKLIEMKDERQDFTPTQLTHNVRTA